VEGFIYPNEAEIGWGILIVLYPYISGIIAGSFLVASLYKLFNVDSLKPVFRLSLLISLAFLIATNFPLISHLGHPERAFEIIITPHLSSAMAIFGYDAFFLLSILLFIILYEYRKDIVNLATQSSGIKGIFYRILTLGDYDISEKALKSDNKLAFYIMWVAFPSVIFLHGYVGFIFGSVKANPWWNTSLMPLIFLFSGIVSGMALVLLIYVVIFRTGRDEINLTCFETLANLLLFFLVIDVALELLELAHFMYLQEEGIELIYGLITDKLFITFFILQIGSGGIIPVVMLVSGKISKSMNFKKFVYILSSLFVLIGVLAMRWNVIIGGQIISKSMRGFSSYHLPILGQEGLIMAAISLVIPFVLLGVLIKLFPVRDNLE